MWIICLTPIAPGVYNDNRADHITSPPEGWAMIPDDFHVPSTYPRLSSIRADELTYTREVERQKEVTKTREVESFDDDGNLITVTEEYIELETITEEQEYTVMTVTDMTESTLPVPEPEYPQPSSDSVWDELDAAYQEGVNSL